MKKKNKITGGEDKKSINAKTISVEKFFSKIYNNKKYNIGVPHAAMAYDEAIVKYHQPRTKFNFPEGMPIEDQSDDDDGFWA